ncbi:uncharacterized protein RCC_07983 [Ramularia collo-cygni]|uniref:Uncharacterized protein n=1 Tax=Ramularia collo-cygni TaxID=112498 RepID=A0A2D3VGR8_9PEZI|nr:uncharacterized protein RCC_07983 [Ramularia collo-cygni]CZT22114.1 uncharacterized protein RCC_07983 [Ramularia collo-cygni]
MKHIGVSGHGPAWVRLASHVEGIAKQYLDKDIDLHIEDALFTELATPGPSSILDEEETARCHVESQAMLMQFRLLADVPVSELKRYIEVLEAAVESQYMIVVPVSEIKRHVKVREAAERNALRRQQ